MTDLNVSLIIKAIDQATGPLARVRKRIDETFEPARRLNRSFAALYRETGLKQVADQAGGLGRSLSRTSDEAGKLALKVGAVATGAGFAFKKLFVDTAAQFEKYQIMLKSLEGSNEAAAKSMDWVSRFATSVPYELDDMMNAFVRLRTFGIDPTDGTLQALVDQTAKMGGSAADMQGIILAVGQAWTKSKLQGEEALQLIERGVPVWDLLAKRMGITAAQVQELSSKGRLGRNAIRALVEEMGKSSKGAAADQAKTWSGMISMISDQWTRFANKVMGNGVFDWLKGKLAALLETLNALADSGRMDEMAAQFGGKVIAALETLWTVMQEVWAVMQATGEALKWLHDLFGSWKPIIIGVAAIMAGPLLLSIVGTVAAMGKLLFAIGTMPMLVGGVQALGKVMGALGWTAQLLGGALLKDLVSGLAAAGTAVRAFGAALLTTPVGWILAAVAAIAGAVYLIYKNWDSITKWFTDKFNAVKEAFKGGFLQGVVKLIQEFNPFTLLLETLNGLIKAVTGFDLAAMLKEKIQGMTDILPDWVKEKLGLSVNTSAPTRTIDPGAGRAEVGGLIRVEVTGDGRPQVREATGSGGVQMEAETYSAWGVAP